jgi:lipid-A-disaccharide synthase
MAKPLGSLRPTLRDAMGLEKDSQASAGKPSSAANGLALVAGEVSGDLLAAAVLEQLREAQPQLSTFGIGGPNMTSTGFDAWWSSETLAVRGFVEVLSVYPKLAGIRRELVRRLLEAPPRLFVGVDAPDFNLELERRLKEKKVRTAHFISPSIWAWRGGRIDKIGKAVDHMLVVFPFEEQIYRKAKIPATFVGHPMADQIPIECPVDAAREKLGFNKTDRVIAILPGSRQSEVEHNGPRFIKTMQEIARLRDDWVFVLPAATDAIKEIVKKQLAAAGVSKSFPLKLLSGRSHRAIAASDGVLVASGTATLECALFKKPMVIAYHMNPISYQIMKPMAYLPFVGLPNILSGAFVVPEFIQAAARPKEMAFALITQVESDEEVFRLKKRFTEIHLELKQDCAHRTSQVLQSLME